MFTEECIVFDLETTGLDPNTSEITEIGAWHFKDGVAVNKFEQFVRTEKPIPPEITKLTGITNDMVKDADTIETVLLDFLAFIGDLPLVAYNLPFDSSFLISKGNFHSIDVMMNGDRLGLDALAVARRCFPNVSHKLTDMTQMLGIDLKNAHRASYDAYATKLVLDRCQGFVFTPIIDKSEYGTAQNKKTLPFV